MSDTKRRLERLERKARTEAGLVKCPRCKGKRRITENIPIGIEPIDGSTDYHTLVMVCPECFGTGKIKDSK